MADIFVSYTSVDRDWAFWIGKELEAQGHVPHIHEWEIAGGGDIYTWMESRHDAADHVLCVVSDAYLQAPYSTLERNAAIWQAVTKRPGFALLVAVAPCRLPTLVDHIRRCELFGVSDEEARSRFRAFMDSRSAPATALFPGQAYAVSNIPVRVPEHFMGREEALASLEAALMRTEGRVAVTALHGLRGVGKTTLAAAYAERHRTAYRATWWIRAQSEPTMRADLVGLAVRLGWVAGDETEEPALARLSERLRHEGDGLLLIYDNAPDAATLRPFLPKGGGAQVLVTSNAHAWRGLAEPVELGLWTVAVGADYLLARTGLAGAGAGAGAGTDRAAAEALSEALGGLPLAHEQAAAYCERLDVPLAAYLARFEATPAKLLDAGRDSPAEYHDGLTVAKTFALAIDEAAKLHPAAEPLIVLSALLAPEPIPLFIFGEGSARLGEPLASLLAEDELDEAVAALRAFALIDREAIPDERDPTIATVCMRLHRLVRQVAAGRCLGETRDAVVGGMIELVAGVYPQGVSGNLAGWPRARRLDAVALALVAESSRVDLTSANLLTALGDYRVVALAAYAQARSLYERALVIREQALGPDHPDCAASLNDLSVVLSNLGDFAGARPLCERALAIHERVLGPDHPDTAGSLDNLAQLLQGAGDLSGARPLYERALAIHETAHGAGHLETAGSLASLANLLKTAGELDAARPLYERALAIYEAERGPDHPDTGRCLKGLANLLHLGGDPAAARPLYERAAAICETAFGPDHHVTAGALNSLAQVLHALGDLAGARTLYERALAIHEQALGPDHPDTALSLNNLATLLHATGDPAGARPLCERAFAIYERQLGADHPDTANSLHNLAAMARDAGDLVEARTLFERALAVIGTSLGLDHPRTSRCRRNLGTTFLGLGEADQALACGESALAAHDRLLGPDHPWTRDSAALTAEALDALGRASEARAIRERYGLVQLEPGWSRVRDA